MTGRVLQMIDVESQRLDRQDRVCRDWLQKTEGFQEQALRLLHLILDRLPPGQALQ